MKKIIVTILFLITVPIFAQTADTTAVINKKVIALEKELADVKSKVTLYRQLLLASLLERDDPKDLIIKLYLENQTMKERLKVQSDNIGKMVKDIKSAKTDQELKETLHKYKLR